MALLDIIILCALVRVNLEMDNPLPCTVIYTVITLFFGLIMAPWLHALIATIITAALAYVFFLLLIKTKNTGAWWAVAVIGVLALGLF